MRSGSKIYLQPQNYLLATINDIQEIQNGKGTFSDIPNGKIHFLVNMYRTKWEYQFTVTDIGNNRCMVEIRIGDEMQDTEDKILREFALLDSMLISNTKIEVIRKAKKE